MKKLYFILLLACFSYSSFKSQELAPCLCPTGYGILDGNNVNCFIGPSGMIAENLVGGDVAGYEVPAGSGKNAIFSMGTWVGAKNNDGDILLAASTFRQAGCDFWPGPISNNSDLPVNSESCETYDRVWKVNRWEVDLHRLYYQRLEFDAANGTNTAEEAPFESGYTIAESILTWPGNGDVSNGEALNLAPFIDYDSDGLYNASNGDYPAFYYAEFGPPDKDYFLFGDQAIWWIMNDVGNIHTEFDGQPLEIEIHGTAYAFHTDDDLDNTTFFRFKFFNRSDFVWNDTWFGNWTDGDLGCFNDDFVQCDVTRNKGIFFNGDDFDENCSGVEGYGSIPPAIAIDFLEGPFADIGDGIDNDKDGEIDEFSEHCSMNKFLHYYNSNSPVNGNPIIASHCYDYLSGKWKNGANMTFGGDGTNPDNIICDYMYPGISDPLHFGTEGVDPGIWWTEASVGNTPMDKRFLQSSGPFTVEPGEENNFHMAIVWARSNENSDPVSLNAICEASDGVQSHFDDCFNSLPCQSPVTNFNLSIEGNTIFAAYPYSFETATWSLGNGTELEGQFLDYTYDSPGLYELCLTVENCGESVMLCEEIYISPEGLFAQIPLTRIEGRGNGGNEIRLQNDNQSAFFEEPYFVPHLEYQSKKSPVKIYVPDTDDYELGQYALAFIGVEEEDGWKMWKVGTEDTIYSALPLEDFNYQYIPEWGLLVEVQQYFYSGGTSAIAEPIHYEIQYENGALEWLSFLEDNDGPVSDNWIRSGSVVNSWLGIYDDHAGKDVEEIYENFTAGKWAPSYLVARDSISPFSSNEQSSQAIIDGEDLPSVELVLTSDKSKWTRSIVLEMSSNPNFAFGEVDKMQPRAHSSLDKNGNSGTPEASFNGTQETGMSWFPGYAINLETGYRMNIAFGENSWLTEENGFDMLWNPSVTDFNSDGEPLFGGMHNIYLFRNDSLDQLNSDRMPQYDEGEYFYQNLVVNPTSINRRRVFRACTWVSIPLLTEGFELLSIEEGLIPTETKIFINVSKHYDLQETSEDLENNGFPLYNFTLEPGITSSEYFSEQIIGIDAFPNPTSGELVVNINSEYLEKMESGIFDMQGNLVSSDLMINGRNTLSLNLARGIYLLVVSSKTGILGTKKIVIK